MLDENIDGQSMLFVLLVDGQGLLIQTVLGGDLGNFIRIVVLQLVDVANDFALVSAHSREEQEVLQVAVLAEGGWFDNDFLQELNQLNGEICLDKRLDSDGNIIRVCAFGESGGDNLSDYIQTTRFRLHKKPYLINQLATVKVSPIENLRPKIWLASLDEITRLLLEHRVLVGNGDELVITEPFCIGNVREVRVALLAELSDNHGVVELH